MSALIERTVHSSSIVWTLNIMRIEVFSKYYLPLNSPRAKFWCVSFFKRKMWIRLRYTKVCLFIRAEVYRTITMFYSFCCRITCQFIRMSNELINETSHTQPTLWLTAIWVEKHVIRNIFRRILTLFLHVYSRMLDN